MPKFMRYSPGSSPAEVARILSLVPVAPTVGGEFGYPVSGSEDVWILETDREWAPQDECRYLVQAEQGAWIDPLEPKAQLLPETGSYAMKIRASKSPPTETERLRFLQ